MDHPTTPFVDKKSPIPAYHQIAQDMIDRIMQGEWDIGEKMPPEAALAAEYNVSRVTLRQSMAHLEARGIIQRYQGKGAYVSSSPKPFVEDLNFPSLDAHKTTRNDTRLIALTQLEGPARYASRCLGVSQEVPLVFLQRLFLRKGTILGLNNVWFPAALVPDLVEKGLLEDSISKTLRVRYQHAIQRIENTVEAAHLSVRDAQLLNASPDVPVLKILSVHYLASGQAVEFSSTTWLGDLSRFQFIVEADRDK